MKLKYAKVIFKEPKILKGLEKNIVEITQVKNKLRSIKTTKLL